MFLLLIAGILIASSPFGQEPPPDYQPASTLVGTALLTLAGALSGLVLRFAASRPAPLTAQGQLGWHRRLSRLTWLGRGLLVGSYLYSIHGFHWPVFVSTTLGLRKTVALPEVLVLTPFLLSLLGALVLGFPGQRRLSGQAWRLGEYLLLVLRQYWAFLLLPWLLYVVVLDLMELVLAPRLPMAWRPPVEWGVVLALMVLLYAFWPLALRWLWPTSRLPDGPLRSRLEALCRRTGVGYREMLVWRSPLDGPANAAVAGLAAPFRYILFTNVLLIALEPEEVEAVLGHELGHVLRGHMPYYLLFALGFVALAVVADIWVGGSVPEPFLSSEAAPTSWAPALGDLALAALVIGLYWGALFGWLSRRFEREADLVAAELTGEAEPFARALEKIARLSGRPPERPGWRHFSIRERTRFLRASAEEKTLSIRAAAQTALIRRLLLLGTTAALVAAVLSLWLR